MQETKTYTAGLYCRLSKDDEQQGESVSIGTQRAILEDYCKNQGHRIHKIYIDDGYSGLNFDRPGFRELLADVERGAVNLVITKDLSRLGRDYIMTGYYSEIFFPTKGVRYIALADGVDTLNGISDLAPFKNILNDMYARDISQKIRNAKRQRAKQGLLISSHTPYGYRKDPSHSGRMIVDPEAAGVVRQIFSMAEEGLGSVAIRNRLRAKKVLCPSVYKFQNGDTRFGWFATVQNGDLYGWNATTISQMLYNPVYVGDLVNLKTEVVNYKTKQKLPVPPERQIVTPNAHEAIITREQFDRVHQVRAAHRCPAEYKRFNLFRGKLFCQGCGHPLMISHKQLVGREADIYLCMHHTLRPDECPQTHRVYHDMLYPYVLQQVRSFARSMKRRKVNSPISDYADIDALTPEILDAVIERIEVGHVTKKSKPGNVIRIYWKLK